MSRAPHGWTVSALHQVTSRPSKTDPASTGRESVRYIDIGLLDGPVDNLAAAPEVAVVRAPSRCRQVVATGDTLYSTVRPYLRKIAYVSGTLDQEFASTGYSVLRANSAIEAKYLYYFCLSPQFEDQILPFQKGVSYPAVLDKEVRAQSIWYPVTTEQRRIVEILDDHLSRLDAAADYASAALARLESLRARTLMDSRTGDLLPLSSLAWDSGYGTSAKCVPDGPGPAVVRIPNLIDGRVDLTDEKRVASADVDVSSSMLAPDDLLIVRTNGSVDLIGRSAVVQRGVVAAFASYLIRYRLRVDAVRPPWVHAMLSTPQARQALESLAASSAGQHNLSLAKLNPLTIPVPSLREQDTALSRLNEIGSHTGALLHEINVIGQRTTALRRAVLAAAFSGKLTGHRTDDEVIEEMAQ